MPVKFPTVDTDTTDVPRSQTSSSVRFPEDKYEPKKSLYSLWGAEVTQKMERTSPYLTAIAKTAQEGIATPALSFLNMAGAGIPAHVARKYGYEMPQPETLPGRILTGGANVAGFVGGAPLRLGRLASKALPPLTKATTLGGRVGLGATRGAVELGTAAGAMTPEDNFLDWKSRMKSAVVGGVVGATGGAVTGAVSHFTSLLSQKSLLGAGEKVRSEHGQFKGKLTNWFGKKLERFQQAKPNQKVSLKNELDVFKSGLDDKAKFKTLLRSSPRLRKAVDSGDLSLKETQDLINQLKSTVSEGQLALHKVRPSNGEVIGFIDTLQKAKHRAFPEMRITDTVYGRMKDYTNAVENIMSFGKTVKGFKTAINNPETRKALETVLPKEIFNKVLQTAQAQTFSKETWTILDRMLRYGLIYGVTREVVKNIKDIDSGGATNEGLY